MHTTFRRFAVFSVLIGFALSVSAAVPPVEKLLPDDTLFMLTTPDFAKARQQYRSYAQMQFWDDPAMKPFKEKFVAKLNETLIQPLEKDLGVKFEDYTNLAQGQITFAVTQNDWPVVDGAKPGLLFLLDTKDQSGQLKKNLADLRKKLVDSGRTVRTEKVRNVDFAVVPISDKDMPKTLKKFSGPDRETDADESSTTNAPKYEIWVGQSDSLLIIGTAAKPIEKVLVHATGGEMPSLGDLAIYEANRLSMFRDAPFYAWANSKSVIDLLTRKKAGDENTPDPFAMFDPTKLMTALGFSGVKSIAMSVQVANDGSTVQLLASMPSSSHPGIFALLPEGKDAAPPPFVPADAVKFERYRVDGKKGWDTIQNVLNNISPQAKTSIKFMIDTVNAAAKEKDPDFDMNKNFFGNLGDDMISYEKAPKGATMADLSAPPSIFLLGSPNPDQIVGAFKYLVLLVNPQGGDPKEREFLGHKIYTAALPGAAAFGQTAPGGESSPRSLSYAASSGYVAISTDASMIEEYFRSSDSQQKALRDTPGLTDAIAKAGGSSTGWLGYENQAETTRAVFEALRNGSSSNSSGSAAAMMLGMSGLPNANAFKEWMDFSLLPPFDKVSKYFGFNVHTVSSTPDGVLLKMYAPVPAGLRK
jgi:hypothetical protein